MWHSTSDVSPSKYFCEEQRWGLSRVLTGASNISLLDFIKFWNPVKVQRVDGDIRRCQVLVVFGTAYRNAKYNEYIIY